MMAAQLLCGAALVRNGWKLVRTYGYTRFGSTVMCIGSVAIGVALVAMKGGAA